MFKFHNYVVNLSKINTKFSSLNYIFTVKHFDDGLFYLINFKMEVLI
jgi:hypothetical protein